VQTRWVLRRNVNYGCTALRLTADPLVVASRCKHKYLHARESDYCVNWGDSGGTYEHVGLGVAGPRWICLGYLMHHSFLHLAFMSFGVCLDVISPFWILFSNEALHGSRGSQTKRLVLVWSACSTNGIGISRASE